MALATAYSFSQYNFSCHRDGQDRVTKVQRVLNENCVQFKTSHTIVWKNRLYYVNCLKRLPDNNYQLRHFCRDQGNLVILSYPSRSQLSLPTSPLHVTKFTPKEVHGCFIRILRRKIPINLFFQIFTLLIFSE